MDSASITSGHIDAKPVLPVTHLARETAFYERLGFDVEVVAAGYALVIHGGDEILHLREVPTLDTATNSASAYLHVGDADAWHEAWTQLDIAMTHIDNRPWQMREFTVVDPSGNLLRIGCNL